jgi:hypothetical protein
MTFVAGPAAAVTVTFDVGPGGLLSSYTENGMTVTPVLGFHVADVADHDGDSSRDLLNRPVCCTTPYEFTYSGGVFSVAKFDFVLNAGPHVFTASGGAMVSPGASGTVVLPPAGWTGITSFRWDANGTQGGTETALMDNLKFCPGDCNDGNVCTDDACDPDDAGADVNGCTHVNNSAPCSDGTFCNGADTCSGGSCSLHAGDPCVAGLECANTCNEAADNCLTPPATPCTDDGNVCTDDQCNGTGSCVHPNNTGPCTDGLFCNGTDTCSGGSCVVHTGDPCTGGSECGNICNEAADTCNSTAGTPCTDDGNVCTNDQCNGGGACIHPNNSAPCTDGLFCNGADTCAGGSCSIHAGDPCAGGVECNNTCNEAVDNCLAPNGTACTDDGNVCTDDKCNGSGSCNHPPNTAPCNDNTFCNGADTCSGGSCIIHAGNPCTAGPECNNVCNEGANNCLVAANTPCSTDGNVCTDDKCNGTGTCAHTNNIAPCSDGTVCTTPDVCSGGACVPGPTIDCDDHIQCTLDSCDATLGCQHSAPAMNGQSCDDGDSCTDNDTCNNGTCAGTPGGQSCDDGNPCTADLCDPMGGCLHPTAPRDNFGCDDQNPCTTQDVCHDGICSGQFTQADTDGDGYCDIVENTAGCNPNDSAEIPFQPTVFSGRPGKGQQEALLTYAAPAVPFVTVSSDPSCQTSGTCGPIGFCTAGKIADPCGNNTDCDQPANTCRLVVNYANVPDIALLYAKLQKTILTPTFSPAKKGCSRKVSISIDPSRAFNKLKLKASGTVTGRIRRDTDSFKYFNF